MRACAVLGQEECCFHQASQTQRYNSLGGSHQAIQVQRATTVAGPHDKADFTENGLFRASYISRAEDLKLDLVEAGQEVADALFRSLVLKGLTSHFDSLVAVISYGTEKDWEQVKQDIINFSNSRGLGEKTATALHSDDKWGQGPMCFKCKQRGHVAKDCKNREQRTCRICGIKGHLAKDCRKAKQPGGSTQGNSSTGGLFSFTSSLGSDQGGSTELVLDSGCNGFMIKEKHLVVDLDE